MTAEVALVVEDDADIRALLSTLLSATGFRCLEAEDAEQALTMVSLDRPILGVFDIGLPGISGAELAWRVRQESPHMRLVAVSAQLDVWDSDDLTDVGFDRIFPKPLDRGEFMCYCRGVLAQISRAASADSPLSR